METDRNVHHCPTICYAQWWPQPKQPSCLLPCLRHFPSKSSRRQRIMKGCCGSLLSARNVHSVWLHDLAGIVVSRGHSRWCPAYLESEQASLNTTEVTAAVWSLFQIWCLLQGNKVGSTSVWQSVGMLRWGAQKQPLWNWQGWGDNKRKQDSLRVIVYNLYTTQQIYH